METVLKIEGMTCERCEERVVRALRLVPGVVQASVDWQGGSARVDHDGDLGSEHLVQAIEEASQGTHHHYLASVLETKE